MLVEALALSAAIVLADPTPLRAAPRDSAQQQAQLWPGEMVEVRGNRLDYVQVWDHRRERGGYVRASQLRRVALQPADAPELLSLVRFVRETPGAEALGLGLVAAYIQAAPAQALRGAEGVEAFDAMGRMADRLAHRASYGASLGKTAQAALAGHLDVAHRYGIKFRTYEREGRMQVCYEGEAFRRVLAMESQPLQKARAALALTRPGCVDPGLQPLQRHQHEQWRADVLDLVDTAALPGYLKNRVHMRRTGAWSTLAFQRTRQGRPADSAAQRGLAELAGVDKHELADVDLPAYAEAAMRASATRWAAVPPTPAARYPMVVTLPGAAGDTCVLLVDEQHGADRPLAKRCTYAVVWPQSASLNREGNALALAVQPMEAWRELWIFRKRAGAWSIDILPPAATSPDIGYAEFAGWVPGGQQVLVAREAQGEGRYRRSFDVVSLDSLATQRQSPDPAALGSFLRWQDAGWKRMTVSVR